MWSALNPAGIFGGGAGVNGAARVFGASAAGVGFFGAYWSWVGFEMAPNYAEEAQEPEEDDGLRHLHLLHRARRGLHVLVLDARLGLRQHQESVAVGRLDRVRDQDGARKRRACRRATTRTSSTRSRNTSSEYLDEGPVRDPDHHWLVRLLAGLLEHVQPLPVLDGSRGDLPAHPRPNALHPQEPVRRDALRRRLLRRSSRCCSRPDWSEAASAHTLGIGVSNPLVALSQIGTWLPFQGNLLLFPIMALCSIAIMVYFFETATRRLPLVQDVRRTDPGRGDRSSSPST